MADRRSSSAPMAESYTGIAVASPPAPKERCRLPYVIQPEPVSLQEWFSINRRLIRQALALGELR